MSKKSSTSLVFLYNALYSISSKYDDLKSLESEIFEVMDEIDSCILTGFNDQALKNYEKSGIDKELVNEIGEFGKHVSSIENRYWNPIDFGINEDWKLARSWANSLIQKLRFKKTGWIFGKSNVLYVK